MKTPQTGVGGYGTISEFSDLTGMTLTEVDVFLQSLKAKVTLSQSKQYLTYKDVSEIYCSSESNFITKSL